MLADMYSKNSSSLVIQLRYLKLKTLCAAACVLLLIVIVQHRAMTWSEEIPITPGTPDATQPEFQSGRQQGCLKHPNDAEEDTVCAEKQSGTEPGVVVYEQQHPCKVSTGYLGLLALKRLKAKQAKHARQEKLLRDKLRVSYSYDDWHSMAQVLPLHHKTSKNKQTYSYDYYIHPR